MLTETELTACIESRRARLTRMAASMLGNHPDAEDVVQESARKALRAGDRFRSEADVCTWFQRICINSVAELARRRTSEQHRMEALRHEALWRDPGYTVDPEAVVIAIERNHRLEAALASLTAEQRLAVVLHDLGGWRAREIAEQTGQPLPTVKSQLRRGRQALVTLLAEGT